MRLRIVAVVGAIVAVVAVGVAAAAVRTDGPPSPTTPTSRSDAGAPAAIGEQQKTTITRHSNGITAVVVNNDAGDVELSPGPTKIVRTERWAYARPTVTEEVRDGVLTITARCPQPPLSLNQCSTRFVISASAKVRVSADVSAGDVTARGLRGVHDLRTSAGDVTVVEGRATRVVAATSAGDVIVDMKATPELVRARTSSGDIEVRVPAGRYAVSARTTSGDTHVAGVQDDSSAPRRIDARTTSGDVTVQGR